MGRRPILSPEIVLGLIAVIAWPWDVALPAAETASAPRLSVAGPPAAGPSRVARPPRPASPVAAAILAGATEGDEEGGEYGPPDRPARVASPPTAPVPTGSRPGPPDLIGARRRLPSSRLYRLRC